MSVICMHKFSVQTKVKRIDKKAKFFLNLFPGYIKGSWILCCLFFRIFFRKNKRKIDTEVVDEGKSIFNLTFSLDDPTDFTRVKKKKYDLGTAMVIWTLLDEGGFFVDVGANNGYLSSIASQRVGKTGLVLSLEPNRSAFQKILDRQLINVIPLNFAVSNINNLEMKLHKSIFRQTTSSYFLPGGSDAKSITLDYLYQKFNCPNVNLLKIDTEGAELFIIEGAKTILSETDPRVILEASNYSKNFNYMIADIFKKMKELGYAYQYTIDEINISVELVREENQNNEGQLLFSKTEIDPNIFKL